MAVQRNIPLIFLPGTGASSLDTSTPFDYHFPGDQHTFPEICQTCFLGSFKHHEQVFHYKPGTLDRAGPRVWIGPEGIGYLLKEALVANQGNHYFDVLKFDDSGRNTLFPQIQAGSIMQTVTLEPTGILPTLGIYDSLIRFLTHDPQGPMRLLNTGPNGLYPFPYDWRADLPDLAEQLGSFIDGILQRPDVQAANCQKVALLTHSLGGLVSRTYYLSSPSNAEKVDQVISISGGFGGIVLLLKVLTMGNTWGLGSGPITVGAADWEVQALAQNWGTSYFQLPNSDLWFSDDSHFGGSFDRSYIRDDRQAPILNYAESMAWIQQHHNAEIAKRAETFFTDPSRPAMGDFRAGNVPVPHHRIISRGIHDTAVAVHISEGVSDACQFAMAHHLPIDPAEYAPILRHEAITGDGDGIVSFHGLIGSIGPDEEQVYVLDNVYHYWTPSRREVHLLIKQLLDGTVTSQKQVADTFHSLSDLPPEEPYHLLEDILKSNIISPSRPPQESATPIANHWLLRTRGAVSVEVEDEHGKRIGPHTPLKDGIAGENPPNQPHHHPNLWEVAIAGATYTPGRRHTSVSLSQPGIYTFKFTGRSSSAVDISLTAFSCQTKLDTICFHSIPISEKGRAHFVYNTANPSTSHLLTLEDGGKRQELPPTALLTPAESEDTTPPTTTVSIQNGEIVMSAIDNPSGSGVWRTYYTTDARTFSIYNQPLSLPAEAKLVLGCSIDRNGNREYPGMALPVLQLSQTHVVFTAIAQSENIAAQTVQVINADPIPLTGQLQWEASTDIPWLSIEPKEGTTPGFITLSVQKGQRESDIYTGHVIVRSTTPGVVYAEQAISVVLQEEIF